MVGLVALAFALAQKFEVTLDQAASAPKKKSDLPGLHAATRELGAARKSRNVVVHGGGRMMKNIANLRHRLAFERQAHDLDPMRKDGADVAHRRTQRDRRLGRLAAKRRQIARNRPRADEENMMRQIFARKQPALAQGFLTKRRQTRAAKSRRAAFEKKPVVLAAAMRRQTHRALLAIDDGLARRFVGAHRHQSHPARRGLRRRLVEKGEIHLANGLQDCSRLERRTIKPVLNDIEEPCVQSLAFDPTQFLALDIARTHSQSSLSKNTPMSNIPVCHLARR